MAVVRGHVMCPSRHPDSLTEFKGQAQTKLSFPVDVRVHKCTSSNVKIARS